MDSRRSQYKSKYRLLAWSRRLYEYLVPRAYTVIILLALTYTLAVKYFHFLRSLRFTSRDFLSWILADIAFLLVVEVILSLFCSRWPRKWVVRLAMIIAAVICTWSIMNAAWLIRTGNQILPRILLSLFRSPINALCMVGVNLRKMPVAALILLVPSAIALAFFISCVIHPRLPVYEKRRFRIRLIIFLTIAAAAVIARPAVGRLGSSQIGSVGLRFNSQLRAVMSLILSDYRPPLDPKRTIPSFDQLTVTPLTRHVRHNVVVVVLEGVQHNHTSLADRKSNTTPFLEKLADQGVEFSNMRTSLSHTTKALFALFSGRYPSASQDIVETVPAAKPYGGIATILAEKLDYRTAFFQSAMGSFEGRPGLVYNLGFQQFWSRDDLKDPNAFVGYLGSDEFAMIEPVTDWIKAGEKPFFAALLCSITHDPYEVPEWYGTPDRKPVERYRQCIAYTDKFLAALDVELANLGLADDTIFCVVGDHGEAFGEHGMHGHNRIAFEELLHVPFCLRAPFLVEPGSRIKRPVSSIDLTPTILSILGFDMESAGFDGQNVLGPVPEERKVYFAGWMREGPAGFVQGNRKFVYYPTERVACLYDLGSDPLELSRIELSEECIQEISEEIVAWRTDTVFRPNQVNTGRQVLFDRWDCEWTGRVSSAKYRKRPN